MLEHEFVTSDFDKTFVFKIGDIAVNLSKVVSAGVDDPECHMLSGYKDGQNDPVFELKFPGEEGKAFLQEWLSL